MNPSLDELTAKAKAFREKHGVPGIAAAIVTAEDIRTTACGVRVRGRDEPVGDGDRWHIGSCGKSMTAAVFARLAETGKASWQDTVAQLFPDADPAWSGVTITDLLTHFAGVPANLTRPAMKAAFSNTAPGEAQRREVAAQVLSRPPARYGKFRYSNLGYTLAGAAIERLTGMSYEEALGREILRPLGMSSAGFGAPQGDSPWGHPPRWLVLGKGEAVEPSGVSLPRPADNPPVITPAGRLHVSLADWARFIRLFLRDGGGGLLSADSLERITTPPGRRGTYQGMGWAVPHGGVAGCAYFQLGSNLRWVAAALVSEDRRRAALLAVNDGRQSLFRPSIRLGLELLPPVT